MTDPAGPRSSLERPLWGFLGAVLAVVIGVGAYRMALHPTPAPMPVLGTLPPFTLTERSGKSVGSDELRGTIWVADFIFTRCAGICPVLSTALSNIEKRVAEREDLDVRLVSFTVDPSHDTAAVLADYARKYDAGADWLFLTGPHDALFTLVRDGFRLPVADAPAGQVVDPGELVTHSDRLVIVDPYLRVRAHHHGSEASAVDAVFADLERLAREGR